MPRFEQIDIDTDLRRDELIRQIEHEVKQMSIAELESLYYDLSTKRLVVNREND